MEKFVMNKRQIGWKYEDKAVEYLENNGYKILERNYQNRYGEIDLIAQETDKQNIKTICYFEIKFRTDNKFGDALEAVDIRKQKHISKIALYHYTEKGYINDSYCRFDVIAIYGDEKICHIKNAFDFIGMNI